jgi:hypothetical protein
MNSTATDKKNKLFWHFICNISQNKSRATQSFKALFMLHSLREGFLNLEHIFLKIYTTLYSRFFET